MDWDFSVIQHLSPLALILVFAGGVLTSIGPCNMTMIPLIVGYVGGSRDLSRGRSFVLSATFATGLALTFMLLGVIVSFVGGLVGAGHKWFYYIVAGICILIGLQLLGLIHLPMPDFLAAQRQKMTWRGVPGALALGLVSGLVSSQCATPVLAAILTYVMAEGAVAYGALLLFVYALGRGVPIVAAGTFTGALKGFRTFGRWTGVLEKVSGLIIIGVALYLIWIS
ncbi:MAG: cytochrome c biogenesis CcdA family protein [Chloroflexi bacterium]|nr:cytochrome c biogenesis CcdA family protein [Chloroflexota bacterium]